MAMQHYFIIYTWDFNGTPVADYANISTRDNLEFASKELLYKRILRRVGKERFIKLNQLYRVAKPVQLHYIPKPSD